VGVLDADGYLDVENLDIPFGWSTPITPHAPNFCLGPRAQTALGTHANYVKRVVANDCKAGRGATLLGASFGVAFVCRGCGHNMDNAIAKRHCAPQPPYLARGGCYDPFIIATRAAIEMNFMLEMSILAEEWILRWPLVKRLAINYSMFHDELLPGQCDAFIKREVSLKRPTKARGIQCYVNGITQAFMAPTICALQKAASKVMWFMASGYPEIDVTFGSGLNGPGFARWMTEAMARHQNCWFYERDGSNWDSTMNEQHHKLCMAIYSLAGPDVVTFLDACSVTVNTFHSQGSRIRWRVRFTRRSGHNDTSLSNSLVNAAILAESCYRCGLRASIIVNGDDALVAISGDFDSARLAAVESEHGIRPEFRKFHSPYDVSFVSGVWFPGDVNFMFAPKPGRLLVKLFWTVKDIPKKKRLEYVTSVARGLYPTCHSMPIIGEFLRVHIVTSAEPKFKYNFDSTEQLCSSGIYDHFAIRYGVAVADLLEVEQLIRDVGPSVSLIRHWVTDVIISHDTAGLDDRPLSNCPLDHLPCEVR